MPHANTAEGSCASWPSSRIRRPSTGSSAASASPPTFHPCPPPAVLPTSPARAPGAHRPSHRPPHLSLPSPSTSRRSPRPRPAVAPRKIPPGRRSPEICPTPLFAPPDRPADPTIRQIRPVWPASSRPVRPAIGAHVPARPPPPSSIGPAPPSFRLHAFRREPPQLPDAHYLRPGRPARSRT